MALGFQKASFHQKAQGAVKSLNREKTREEKHESKHIRKVKLGDFKASGMKSTHEEKVILRTARVILAVNNHKK